MLHVDYALFHHHECRVAVIFHIDMEGGAAHRNDRSRSPHPIRVRLAADSLDMHFDVTQEHIQQFSPVTLAGSKLHLGIGVDFERASVGQFEHGPAIRSGDDQLPRLHGVADVQDPRLGVAHDVHATSQEGNGSGAIRRPCELGRGRASQCDHRHKWQPVGA